MILALSITVRKSVLAWTFRILLVPYQIKVSLLYSSEDGEVAISPGCAAVIATEALTWLQPAVLAALCANLGREPCGDPGAPAGALAAALRLLATYYGAVPAEVLNLIAHRYSKPYVLLA